MVYGFGGNPRSSFERGEAVIAFAFPRPRPQRLGAWGQRTLPIL